MDRVVRYLEVEGEVSGMIPFHEMQGLVRNGIDSLWIFGGHGSAGVFCSTGEVSRVAIREIVPLLVRADPVVAMIPFPEVCGLVSGIGCLEHARNVELGIVGCSLIFPVFLALVPGRRLASLDTTTRRAAGSGWRIALSKSHTHGGHAFYVRRLEIVTTRSRIIRNNLQGRTHPALIIRKDDDEIGFICGLGDDAAGEKQSDNENSDHYL